MGKTVEELEAGVKAGDYKAAYELGKMCYYGEGVQCDYGKAIGLLGMAADHGVSGATYLLGKMYYNGNGVGTNHVKAKEYFEKSAAANNVFSNFYLGKLYYWGDGVEKNAEKAEVYKDIVLAQPIYGNQDTNLEEFYSIPDFELKTKEYVNEIQNKVASEYNKLFGKID